MISNPIILVSYLNTKLRDSQYSLEDLIVDMDEDYDKVLKILNEAGYHYDPTKKRIVSNDLQ